MTNKPAGPVPCSPLSSRDVASPSARHHVLALAFAVGGWKIGRLPLLATCLLSWACCVFSTPASAEVDQDWLTQVTRLVEARQYRAVEEEGPVEAYRANNPGQGFLGRIDTRGLTVTGKLDLDTGQPAWEWGLELIGWGRPGALVAASEGRLTAEGSRVELERDVTLTEWFHNRPEGLEHGFTVMEPPAEKYGEDGHGLLVFDLVLAGGLRSVFSEDRQAVDFYGSGSMSVLRYAKLLVTDATGATLAAWMEPIPGGVRIAVEDADAVYPVTVDPLATTPAWSAESDQANAEFGWSVATAGDVNGDGYADVVVGAPLYDGGELVVVLDSGRADLYLGSASGLSPTPAWSIEGDQPGAQVGFSVATAGDVNGDGYADVVVGANGQDGAAGSGAGRAEVYLGSASGLSASPAWNVEGDQAGAQHGSSVAPAGDVNGDGYADVVVGAIRFDGVAGVDTGRVALYLGSMAGLSGIPAWSAEGDQADGWFGSSVATAGDVNGDGYADVVVGAYFYDGVAGVNTGRAELYMGSASGLAGAPAWNVEADQPFSQVGWSVATAGDVNGDGYADVIVGANGYDGAAGSNSGRADLYLGSAVGLSGTPAWSPEGDLPSSGFGSSVAPAGDVNGDGYADVVVGADGQFVVTAGALAGRAYLYLGSAAGLAGAPTWSAEGDQAGARLGVSVAPAGDVNGDGYTDVVVGANLYDGGAGADTGRADLYLGSATGLSTTSAWSAESDQAGGWFGISVAPAGDVNGDGHADVVVGAFAYDGVAGADTGRADLYLGSAAGLSTTPAWSIEGDQANALFGVSVATAGDVNGDGYADVVAGASVYDGVAGADTGRAQLYLGSAAGLSTTPAWSIESDQANAHLGVSVATAGDVNGDGYADVVVGADFYDGVAGGDTGRADLYLGSAAGLSTTPAWSIEGDQALEKLGRSVATAGDVNGDGYADVVVGAYFYTGVAGLASGRADLYLGSAAGLSITRAWSIEGDQPVAGFGISVAPAGDVNGDGYADVVVGAYQYDGVAGADTGRADLYLGSFAGLSALPAWSAESDQTQSWFGHSVASAGDVNGDGYADVIVGSSVYDGVAGADTGRADLYLGSSAGLSALPAWSAESDQADAQFGISVSTAGDVNGDGYADVVVGAYSYDGGAGADSGQARLYLGGGGRGVSLRPRQLRADLSAPIPPGGRAYQLGFNLGLNLHTPMGGATARRVQWQVAQWGQGFATRFNPIQSDTDWFITTVPITELIDLPTDNRRYIWRARVQYDAAQSPFVGWSRWFTISGNGPYETDLYGTSQAPPPPCSAPDEEIYILNMALDLNGKPVLTYLDPNQPSEVTGYNIYRASDPSGPWTLLGSNVVDMDQGLANNQYVDQTGDAGGPWFYQVAPFNSACGAEGPW